MAKKRTKSRSQSARPRQTGTVSTAERPPQPPRKPAPPRRGGDVRRARQTGAPASVPPMLVVAGVIAVVGLAYLFAAGIGAGVLIAGLLAASVYVVLKIREVGEGESGLVTAQKGVVLALVFLLPVTIDPRTADVFATVKFTVLMCGTVVLLALFLIDRLLRPRGLRWTPLHWIVAFLVVWATISTFASGHVALSFLGFYSSNNGLFTYLGLAILFLVVADLFRPRDARPLAEVLWYATGGVVVLYGVLQLLDQAWPGHGLEPVNWPAGVGVKVFGTTGVWSTLGNPNHLGGLCAILLPVGITLFLLAERWWERALSGAIGAGAALVIGQTSSRGAWVATFVGLVLVAIFERQRIGGFVRRYKLVSAAAVVVVAAALAFSSNSGLLSKGSSALFETGGGSTVAQRVNFWKTTVKMAADRPLAGYGFDGYRLTWPHYMSRHFAETWDPELQVTGPHNTFFASLYWGGWPALLGLILVVVALLVLMARLRRRAPDAIRAGLAPVLGISAIAFLIVESFNVERLEFSAILWVALGVIVATARATSVAGIRMAHETAASSDAHEQPTSRRRTSQPAISPAGAAVSAVVAVVALFGLFYSTKPWRADLDIGRAGRASKAASALRASNPDLANQKGAAATRDLQNAAKTNPWEARYLRTRGDQLKATAVSAMDNKGDPGQISTLLDEAAKTYRKALALTPHDAGLSGSLAETLLRQSAVTGTAASRDSALSMLGRETRYGGYNAHLRAFYAQQLAAAGETKQAVAEVDAALRHLPDNPVLLDAAVKVYTNAGETAKALRAKKRLSEVSSTTSTTSSTSSGTTSGS